MKKDGSDRLDEAVRSYYERRPEEERLSQGSSQIEAERTRVLFQRLAPSPPAVVIDVGGAAGAYALWLASLDYEVHLVDPVSRLVQLARDRSAEATHALASAHIGDARDLPFEDGSADCVLMLGPLYHLTESDDRALALEEAHRVLRSGGFLFAACITRWASLLNGLMNDRLSDDGFVAMMEEDLRSGQHRNPSEHPGYFTTSYFHTPEGFAQELSASGLALEGVFGLEGPAHLLSDFDNRWAEAGTRAELMRVAREIETEPSMHGMSPHLLGVCRKHVS